VDAGGPPDACTPEAPCALEAGARGQGLIAEAGDRDPWVFEVPAAGRVIDLVLSNDATRSRVQLEAALFAPDGAAVVNRRAPSSLGRQRVEIQVLAEQAGTYRLEVRDVGRDDADRFNPYFLDLRLLESGDANEPNDDEAGATPLSLGTPVNGAIGTQGDRDWFAFDLTAGRRVEVRVSAPGVGAVRHRFSLLAPDGMAVAESTEPEADVPWPSSVHAVGPVSGRFHLVIEDDDGADAETGRVYTVEVRELPEPDPQEQLTGNETADAATPLTPGTPVTGYIAATADADWYAVNVGAASPAAPQLVTAELSYPRASEVELQLALFAPDGETPICEARDGDGCRHLRFVRDGAGTRGPTSLATAHLVTQPGRYLVVVRDLQGDEVDAETPYTLDVALPAEPDPFESYGPDGRAAARLVPPATATTGASITFEAVEGHISYAGDTDWYRFDIPGPEGASPGQNGDWLVEVQIEMPSPTPVELNAFFFGPEDSDRERYRGLGRQCRGRNAPIPEDCVLERSQCLCQWPDADNGVNVDFRTTLDPPMGGGGECFVVFREVTGVGPHYWRMSDLDRDDFDVGPAGRYRLQMTVTAGCPSNSACMGRFTDRGGDDLCGRP
jgi:hypothetical protein